MEKVVWDSETFEVGHELIYHHHRALMDLVNELSDLSLEPSQKKSDYIKILMRINDYAHYHFKAEEGVLMSIHYPDIDVQRDEHLAFSERASFLVTSCDLQQLKQTTQFLKEWLTRHILIEDMKIKSYLAAKDLS